MIVYPIYGIGLLVLAVATVVCYRLDPRAPRAAGPPIYLAALFAVGVIATTVKAAPIMLGVADLGDDNPRCGRRSTNSPSGACTSAECWAYWPSSPASGH